MILLSILGGIFLNIVANELFELLPWFTTKILHTAAKINARFDGESDLLLAEWEDNVSKRSRGKLSKFAFACGILFRVALTYRFDIARRSVGSKITNALKQVSPDRTLSSLIDRINKIASSMEPSIKRTSKRFAADSKAISIDLSLATRMAMVALLAVFWSFSPPPEIGPVSINPKTSHYGGPTNSMRFG